MMRSAIIDMFEDLRRIYELKSVYRAASVDDRKESSAEHSWSCIMLADYFLNFERSLDRLWVIELLLYHDLVEIETGDVPIHHEDERNGKAKEEKEAAQKLLEELPMGMGEKFDALFDEYQKQATPEARFAKGIDKLDALFHELDYKKDWEGWTEEMVRKYHGKAVQEFDCLNEAFEKILEYAKANGYLKE